MTRHLLATPQTCTWGYFDASLPPCLEIESGETVKVETVSGAPEHIPPEGEGFDVPVELFDIHRECPAMLPGHILTGPIAVKGAAPGDVLQIDILDISLRQNWGWNIIRPLSGTLPDEFQTARKVIIPLNTKTMMAELSWGLQLPLIPFFGVMGVAPPKNWGRISSIQPRTHGGNIDNKELIAGTTLYLPVFEEGGLFSCGDGHAAQGDGEVCVTAIETALSGKFRFTVCKGMHLHTPQAETPTDFITMGIHQDLNRCAEDALRNMIDLITIKTGLSREDAYMLCSLAGDLRVTQIVNGNKGIHMVIKKSLLEITS